MKRTYFVSLRCQVRNNWVQCFSQRCHVSRNCILNGKAMFFILNSYVEDNFLDDLKSPTKGCGRLSTLNIVFPRGGKSSHRQEEHLKLMAST